MLLAPSSEASLCTSSPSSPPAAAGGGSAPRVPKQLLDLGGRPILQRSVEAFLRVRPRRRDVIVVVPAGAGWTLRPPYLRPAAEPVRSSRAASAGRIRWRTASTPCRRRATSCSSTTPRGRSSTPRLIERTIDAAAESGAAIAAVRRATRSRAPAGAAGGPAIARAPRRGADAATRVGLPRADAAGVPPRGAGATPSRSAASGAEATDEAALAEQAGHRGAARRGRRRGTSRSRRPTIWRWRRRWCTRIDRRPARRSEAVRHSRRVGLRPASARRRAAAGSRRRRRFRSTAAWPATRTPTRCATRSTDAILGAAGARRHRPALSRHRRAVEGRVEPRPAAPGRGHRRAARAIGSSNVDAMVIAERPKLGAAIATRCAPAGRALGVEPSAGQREGQDERRRRRDRPRRGDRGARGRAAAGVAAERAWIRADSSSRRLRLQLRLQLQHHASPLRPQPHRPPARRQRPHGAVQLAAGARARRHVHPAHRGHRRRAIDARVRGGDPRGPALARPRTGTRGRTSAGRTARTGSPSGCTSTAAYADELLERGPRLLLLLLGRAARGRAPGGAGGRAAAAVLGHVPRASPPTQARGAIAAGERAVVRFRVPDGPRRRRSTTSSAARCTFHTERDRRPGAASAPTATPPTTSRSSSTMR